MAVARAKPEPSPWEKEADLVADFVTWVSSAKTPWTVYAETAGWDVLLVRDSA